MPFRTTTFDTQHEVAVRTPDNRDLVFLTGYALFGFKGTGDQWLRDDVSFFVGPFWNRIDAAAPVASLASIGNDDYAVDAGWAVDNCRWRLALDASAGAQPLELTCALAIRDSDGYTLRLAYQASVIGEMVILT